MNYSVTIAHSFCDSCSGGTPYGLDFDWITGNLYVSTYGCIVACKTRTESAYQCAKIVRGLRDVHGIALHPAEGYACVDFISIMAVKSKHEFFL